MSASAPPLLLIERILPHPAFRNLALTSETTGLNPIFKVCLERQLPSVLQLLHQFTSIMDATRHVLGQGVDVVDPPGEEQLGVIRLHGVRDRRPKHKQTQSRYKS